MITLALIKTTYYERGTITMNNFSVTITDNGPSQDYTHPSNQTIQ